MATDGQESMTLVLALSAVERLARPAEAVADAGRWSRHVGVAGDDRSAVTDAVERAAADPDFVSGESGLVGALSAVRQRFPTDRHVFVSADDADRPTARALGWEFLTVAEAAERAGWELASDE